MIKKISLIALLICLLSKGALATTLCQSEDFLKGGFDVGDHEKCVALFNKPCLSEHILPDEACVEKITKREPVFKVPLEMRDTCLACPTVGTATLAFQFDPKGNFQKTNLESFKSKPNTVGPSCPNLSVTNIHSRTALALFLGNLQIAVEDQNQAAIALLIHYPLRVNGLAKLKEIKSQNEFEKNFSVLFSEKVKRAITLQKDSDLFCRDQGVMIGDGQVWIDERDGKIGIFAINVI